MIKRIHILGASGSGTSTLAEALSIELGYKHLDTDDYYWLATKVPFTEKRKPTKRIEMLKKEFEKSGNWILSGSLCGWGDVLIPYFDLVIYIYTPKEIRINRLIQREKERYGDQVEPSGKMHQSFLEFIEWASKYDEAGLELRSRALHEDWISNIDCPVLRLEGDTTVEDRVKSTLNFIINSDNK